MEESKNYLWRYYDIEQRMSGIHKKYKELVDVFFGDVVNKNSGYFPFYNGFIYSYADLDISFYRGLIYIHGSSDGMTPIKLPVTREDVLKRTERSFDEVNEHLKNNFVKDVVLFEFQMLHVSDLANAHSDDAITHYLFEKHADKYSTDRNTSIGRPVNLLPESASNLPATLQKYTKLLENVNDEEFKNHILEAYECYISDKRLATSLLLGRALELMCRLILNKYDTNIIKGMSDHKRSIGNFLNQMEYHDLIEEHLKHSVKAASEHRNSIMHSIKIEEYNSIIQTLFDVIVKLSNVFKSLDKS
ncbi:hypothetical protein [Staphylococcus haemolyticus]|uniref:hypothetical protein n=1 Tax=Staphylococcus haemolyticus TaxID=1283 RepID=UPI002904B29F|nr:hypothetical protein [Staphylococcus haemolyticus]MDU0439373.1 hypothetical protein [Staphylococcus haemolyticus]